MADAKREIREIVSAVVAKDYHKPSPPVAAPPATPVGWFYTLHMDLGQTEVRFSVDRFDLAVNSPWGRPYHDYSEEFSVTESLAYSAQPQPQPAQPLTGAPGDMSAKFKEALRLADQVGRSRQ